MGITICLPYSLSNSLRELFPVIIIGRLWFSASFDWDDRAHVKKKSLRNLCRVLCSPEEMGIGNTSFPAYWFDAGERADPNSTCLCSSTICASRRYTLMLNASRVSPVQANESNLLLSSSFSLLRRRTFSSTSLIVPSLISAACFSSCKNLSLCAGAGAGGLWFLALDPTP